jgi:GT2 family glycosyltransferase
MAGVSVFIVNFNGALFIKECLDSVLASKLSVPLEIIVVDNQSTDNSLEILNSYLGKVIVIKNYNNSGFSKGNNIASDYAKGDYFFLLNNDTTLFPDTLQKLYDYMINNENIGALVPKLLNKDGSLQAPGSIFGQWKFKSKTPKDVSFVAGAALLMSKHVYESINGLDDNLFFYNDDVDLCKVLLKRKLRIVYYPVAELIHYGGLSTKFRKLSSLIEGYRGGFYVCYKHYGKVLFEIYRIVVFVDILPRLFIHFLKSFFVSEDKDYVKTYLKVITINLKRDIFVKHPKINVEVLK